MTNPVTRSFEALCVLTERTLQARGVGERIVIQVGSATCENAAGARDVMDEFVKHVQASGREDIILHRTGCTGRCSKEPIVGVQIPGRMPVKYERVDRELVHKIFTQHILRGASLREHALDASLDQECRYEFLFCEGRRCEAADLKLGLRAAFQRKLQEVGVPEGVVKVGTATCFGACNAELAGTVVHILVRPSKVIYRARTEADLDEIIRTHVLKDTVAEGLQVKEAPLGQAFFDLYGDVAFFSQQKRVAMRNNGLIDPEDLFEYVKMGGFKALHTALSRNDPDWIIGEVLASKLRGRGGGGFPTGRKWQLARQQAETTRYMICNGDEGDPGAFMDRGLLESDPFSIVEGMILGGFAIGAQKGYFYIRAEYPLAIQRIQNALDLCRAHGVLGPDVLGSGWGFDMEIRLGAGAFVCGEETALIRSIEGERGQPRVRPPYPAQAGLWGKPTIINNVETLANIAAILNHGGDWFSQIGTETSGGTKVFALAGKVKHTGLVEVPLGIPLKDVVFDIGGGVLGDRALKAVQTGGPAGGFIPADATDMPVDFDPLAKAGSIMGSGGMIVLSEDDCMVDISKFYLAFTQEESCGKCTPCREGTTRMLEILDRITKGNGELSDLDKLERLARLCQQASLCGLGRAAPNPVLSSLRHFRDEYLEHIQDKRCRAKKCVALTHYVISSETCIGCTVCARNCPVECITGGRKEVHVIDQERCIKCGQCYEVCRFDAVERV